MELVNKAPVATVSGAGTTAKVFDSILRMLGSGRMDCKSFVVRASGRAHQNGVAGKVQVSLLGSYPAGQYHDGLITKTALATNVATYTCANNFKAGQLVTVTATTNDNGTFNVASAAIVSADKDKFTVAITHADVPEAAEAVAVAKIQPFVLFSTTARTVAKGTDSPWMIEAELQADSVSGLLQGYASGMVANLRDAEAAMSVEPMGVSLASEPPFEFSVSVTFDVSDAANKAVLSAFILEM